MRFQNCYWLHLHRSKFFTIVPLKRSRSYSHPNLSLSSFYLIFFFPSILSFAFFYSILFYSIFCFLLFYSILFSAFFYSILSSILSSILFYLRLSPIPFYLLQSYLSQKFTECETNPFILCYKIGI